MGRSSALFSATCFVFGTSISMPYSMACAVIIKMMSNTNTTSTNGVTLISESAPAPWRRRLPPPFDPPPFTEMAIWLLPETAFGQIHELIGEIIHFRSDFTNGMAEDVVENGRGNCGGKTHRRGDQGLRDAGADGAQAGAAHGTEILKGADDAENRAEQSNERRHTRGSGKPVH